MFFLPIRVSLCRSKLNRISRILWRVGISCLCSNHFVIICCSLILFLGNFKGSSLIHELWAHLGHSSKTALLADGTASSLACSHKVCIRGLRKRRALSAKHSITIAVDSPWISSESFDCLASYSVGIWSTLSMTLPPLWSIGNSGWSNSIQMKLSRLLCFFGHGSVFLFF